MLLLFLPWFQQKTGIIRYEPLEEKRQKAKYPKLTLDLVLSGKFQAKVEAYYADHFGLRDVLIKSANTANLKLFEKKVTSDVVVGKEGWFYYFQEVNDYEKKSMSSEEIDIAVQRIADFAAQLKRKDIKLVFLITNNKSTIYPEYMPDSIPKSSSEQKSNEELLKPRLANVDNLYFIDSTDLLQEKRKEYPVYSKADTHWNEMGTYVVAQQVLQTLGEISHVSVTLPEIDLETYKLYDQLKGGGADLEKLLGIFGAKKVQEVKLPPPKIPSQSEKLPKILWYGTSFSPKLEKYISPYSSEFIRYHFKRQPMRNNLKRDLPGTKIVVFELIERWLRGLLTYEYPMVEE